MDSGQGHGTVFRQIIADRLGLSTRRHGDRHRRHAHEVPQGTGTFGSRTLAAAGGAIWTRRRYDHRKAEGLGGRTAGGGQIRHHLRDRRIPISPAPTARFPLPKSLSGEPASVSAETFRASKALPSRTAAISARSRSIRRPDVVELVSYCVVDDVGRMVNPLLVKGQITGGVAQGSARR